MKKIFGLLILVIAMAACSSDDDNNGNGLEGTWKMTAFSTQNPYDLNGDGTASQDLMAETSCYQNELMRFNGDGTGKVTSSSEAIINFDLIVGTTNEYEYSTECVAQIENRAFTYVQSGDEVTLSYDGFPSTGTLSNNTLTFIIPSGFFIEAEDPNSGIITVNEDVTIVYTKQ